MLIPQVLCSESIHDAGLHLIKDVAGLSIAPDPSEETLVNFVPDADALIVRSSKITQKTINAGKNLKVIGRHGMGIDNIDLEAATAKGIAVINTPFSNIQSVAEHVLTMMLYLSKKPGEADSALRSGVFDKKGSLPGLVNTLGYNTIELFGKTMGLVGYGKTGRRVAQMCKAGFGMQVCAYDKFLSQAFVRDAGVEPCDSLNSLVKKADFVSIHLPLMPETENLIDLELLSLMKSTAFVINTSRGGIINESDLFVALNEERIAGAAVDVFAQEPPPANHPLFKLNNIIVTPHMAAMTDGALERMARDVAGGVISVLRGDKPEHLVNPAVLD